MVNLMVAVGCPPAFYGIFCTKRTHQNKSKGKGKKRPHVDSNMPWAIWSRNWEVPKGGYITGVDGDPTSAYFWAIPFTTALRELFQESGVLIWKRRSVRQLVYTIYESTYNQVTKLNHQFMPPVSKDEFIARKFFPWLSYDPLYLTGIGDFEFRHAQTIEELYKKLMREEQSPEDPVRSITTPSNLDLDAFYQRYW